MAETETEQSPFRAHEPLRFEADVFDCETEGHIPCGLNGAFVRVGGDWAFPPKHPDDSIFSQDGYVSRFRFKDGKVSYKGRWIQTPRLINNRQAGRQLYGYYRNPYDCDESVQNIEEPYLNTVMNTAVEAHAGLLFAMKEDAPPYRIDPKTLETIGPWDFHGQYKSQTFTAHPKIDPVTGELLTFGYEATGLATDDLFVYSIDKNGNVSHEIRLKMPYVAMIHDFAITRDHFIFPLFGYVTNMERLKAGKVHWTYRKGMPTLYAIVPRNGDAGDVRWFKGPESAVIHTFNAWTENNKIILQAPIFDTNPFPFFPYEDGSRWEPAKSRATIRQLTFDLSSDDDSYTEEVIFPDFPVVDLGRVDERFMGSKTRYGFTMFHDPSKPFDAHGAQDVRMPPANSYGKFDLLDGTYESFFAGPSHSLAEVTFVPRSADAAEGDGWLIGTAMNYASMKTELQVFDTANPAAGPVGKVYLPFRSNAQVHARWYSDSVLDFG